MQPEGEPTPRRSTRTRPNTARLGYQTTYTIADGCGIFDALEVAGGRGRGRGNARTAADVLVASPDVSPVRTAPGHGGDILQGEPEQREVKSEADEAVSFPTTTTSTSFKEGPPESPDGRVARTMRGELDTVRAAIRPSKGRDKALAAAYAGARKLGDFADPDVGDRHYAAVGNLRRALARAGGHAGLKAGLDRLAARMLQAIATPRLPARSYPSVGFEYELPAVKIVTGGVPSKALLAYWRPRGGAGVRLETDGDHVEFVTEPASTMAEVGAQVGAVKRAAANIFRYKRIKLRVPGRIYSDVDGTVLDITVVTIDLQGGVRGRVQGTVACPLESMTRLVPAYGDPSLAPSRAASGKVKGFAHLVGYYLHQLGASGVGMDSQGPKVRLPFMCRTSFRALYEQLQPAEQAAVKQMFRAYLRRDVRLVNGGYKGPAGAPEKGPTVGEWFDSIRKGDPSSTDTEPLDRDNNGTGPRGEHFDRMSPPPGYPAHRQGRHFTYAMGFFGCARDAVPLIEAREIGGTGEYESDVFEQKVVAFASTWLRAQGGTSTADTRVVEEEESEDSGPEGSDDSDSEGGGGAEPPRKRPRTRK